MTSNTAKSLLFFDSAGRGSVWVSLCQCLEGKEEVLLARQNHHHTGRDRITRCCDVSGACMHCTHQAVTRPLARAGPRDFSHIWPAAAAAASKFSCQGASNNLTFLSAKIATPNNLTTSPALLLSPPILPPAETSSKHLADVSRSFCCDEI